MSNDSPNGLRLEDAEVEEILHSLESSDGDRSGRGVRATRYIFGLQVKLTQPGGSAIERRVVTRNVSTGGMAFLHAGYVHPGSRFSASIPTADDGAVIGVAGEVVRCRHIKKMIHEIAIRFDDPIDLPNFAQLSPEDEQRCWKESGKSEVESQERGVALVVDDVKSQRAIAEVWLKRIGYTVEQAATSAETMEAVKATQFDVIVLDMQLGDESGLDLARSLRAAKYMGTIVAVTADADDEIRQQALMVGCDAFVAKPVTARNLDQAIEDATVGQGDPSDREPIYSSLQEDETVLPLIVEFVNSMTAVIDQLSGAVVKKDITTLGSIFKSMKAEGGALGFWQVTEKAEEALASLSSGEPTVETPNLANQLLQVLRRVSVNLVESEMDGEDDSQPQADVAA